MGTYGTTFIKKGGKTIDFTDSHDGYFAGMGKANLLSIKYMSDSRMDELFDSFSAEFDEDCCEEPEVSQRTVEDIVLQAVEDAQNHDIDAQEARQWMQHRLQMVAASFTGFGPLLYLNAYPSNHTGSEHYIIDLDAREFQFCKHHLGEVWTVLSLGFEDIRRTPGIVLDFVCDSLTPHLMRQMTGMDGLAQAYQTVDELFYEHQRNKEEFHLVFAHGKTLLLQALSQAMLINPDEVQHFYDKLHLQEQERVRLIQEQYQQHMAALYNTGGQQ